VSGIHIVRDMTICRLYRVAYCSFRTEANTNPPTQPYTPNHAKCLCVHTHACAWLWQP